MKCTFTTILTKEGFLPVRILLFLSIISNMTLLNAYDSDILNIYSKMLPRFVLMSNKKEKVDKEIKICILYDKVDERDALLLVKKINTNYPNGIKDDKIKLLMGDYSSLDICKNSQSAFLFNSNEKNIKNAISFLNRQEVLSIAYDAQALENGAQISLFIGRKVQPYINIKEILDNNIVLDNILLRVSKIYIKSKQ